MLGSVAVLSDVHGVLPVLDAVLDEPDVRDADRIVVCGDIATGPQPAEVLDRLTALRNVSRLERWAEVFGSLGEDVATVVCGHTHMPFVRLVDRRLVVNPGSIGMPYGRAGGHWALLRDGGVSLRRTEIDVDAAVAAVVAGSTYPGRAKWADEYVRATASDADAIVAFGPLDGR